MLHACSIVLLEISLNLGLALRAECRLVHREQNKLIVAGKDELMTQESVSVEDEVL